MDAHTRATDAGLARDELQVQPGEDTLAELLRLVEEELADDPPGGAGLAGLLSHPGFGDVPAGGRPVVAVREAVPRQHPRRPTRRDLFTPTEFRAVADVVALLRGRAGAQAGTVPAPRRQPASPPRARERAG